MSLLLRKPLAPRPGSFMPGLLVALFSATPALAATIDVPFPLAARELILLGSLLLLSLALGLRIGRRHRHADRTPNGPDMRWWKNA